MRVFPDEWSNKPDITQLQLHTPHSLPEDDNRRRTSSSPQLHLQPKTTNATPNPPRT